MSILNYDIQTEVAGIHDFIAKLRDFALGQGWTTELHTNVKWGDTGGGVYGWVAGSESYFSLYSEGYGNQLLLFRIRGEATGSNPDHEYLQLGAFQAGTASIDTSSSLHPVQHSVGGSNWNTYRYLSLTPQTIPRVFFFGNDKFLLAVIQFTASYCSFLSFGSIELNNENSLHGNFAGYTNQYGYTWTQKNDWTPFDFKHNNILYNGSAQPDTNTGTSVRFSSGNGWWIGEFWRYGAIVNQNPFSTIRPIVKPIVFIKGDDGKFRIVGTFPVYRINHLGLEMGQLLDYGGKKYYTFPMGRLNERYMGIAVRVQ